MKEGHFEITKLENGRYHVVLKGEDEDHFDIPHFKGLSDKEMLREISAIVELRTVRKHLQDVSAAIERTDEILLQFAVDKSMAPPAFAEALISMFSPKRFSEAQLGDMQEIFETNVKRFGQRRAKRLYWYEVARSIGPTLFQWLKRIGFIAILVDYSRRKMGL